MSDNTRKPANSAQEPTVDAGSYSQGEQAERTLDSATLRESNAYSQGNATDNPQDNHAQHQPTDSTQDTPTEQTIDANSNRDTTEQQDYAGGNEPNSPQAPGDDVDEGEGGNTLPGSSSRGESEGETPRAREGRASLTNRWQAEGRFGEASAFMDEIRKAYREEHKGKQGPLTRKELTEYAWQEAARAFPPLEKPGKTEHSPQKPPPKCQNDPLVTSGGGDTARVQGLGDIPQDWLPLPENASLHAELGWVQANRLRIVDEQASGATLVHLDRAGTPAPSMAALGWLETSIRSYAKYVDVVARALSSHEDEQGMVRRERVKIERIRELLAEMREETPGQEQTSADGAWES